ncbi:phytoene dehydrogenase-like protein [Leifsonia psychrotolerans]|uniref:Phytoene dehydrogenase-like protein n=1 Tax=Glaciibacter psychrotolerans TaxID=670054 RepID=A0A7Z0J6K9_9MICO|nr:phytoene dehydrogenase-like protein [Leifsonia psychrotolerans]
MIDVVIVGSGPNGLAAAVVLARAGLSVRVFEAEESIGGGARTLELTEPGFRHDWGSAVHAMAFASPFFQQFGIEKRVPFVVPDVSYGHALDGGQAGIAWRDLARTSDGLGVDGAAWLRLLKPLVDNGQRVAEFVTSPLLPLPTHPLTALSYGLRAIEQGSPLAGLRFRGDVAPAMLAGVYAHSIGRLATLGAGAAGMLLATLAHSVGWAIPVGGSQAITDAMAADFEAHGGVIETGHRIESLDELPAARAVLFDTSARQLAQIAGERLDPSYLRALLRFRMGNAASKVDFALTAPVPWANADLSRTGTVHIGGLRAEVAAAESAVARGQYARSPYVLVSQPSLFDCTRAPAGMHTVWAYTHVPAGSDRDMTEPITAQIERFAPGFRDVILASHATPATELERADANLIGGDIATGAASFAQLLARPVMSSQPWRAAPGLYLCSAATPPGPGVHGMGGFHAARLALRQTFGLPMPSLGS